MNRKSIEIEMFDNKLLIYLLLIQAFCQFFIRFSWDENSTFLSLINIKKKRMIGDQYNDVMRNFLFIHFFIFLLTFFRSGCVSVYICLSITFIYFSFFNLIRIHWASPSMDTKFYIFKNVIHMNSLWVYCYWCGA